MPLTRPEPTAALAETLLDGGTGSELRRRGVALDALAWSAGAIEDHGALLTRIHADYIAAGADVITAATFGATPYLLAAAGLGDRFEAVTRRALDSALAARQQAETETETEIRTALPIGTKEAAPNEPHRRRPLRVAASLGCYPPDGDPARFPDPATELAAYRACTSLYAQAAIDLLLAEMMQETEHAALACRAAAESGLPFWLGVSCRLHPATGELVGFDRTDVPLTATLDALLGFGPAAVCVMHSPLDAIDAALALVRERWNGPLGVYPELPYLEDPEFARTLESPAGFEPTSSADLATLADSWIDSGATIVGGCCGTTPEHIAALRAMLDRRGPLRTQGIGTGLTNRGTT